MAAKTPRTTVKDYLQSVNTEKEAHRVLRRRSVAGDPEKADSVRTMSPGSASNQSERRLQTRSPRQTKNSLKAMAGAKEEEITPRHIIQNMLTVQGTAQPVARKRKRLSDVVMGPPSSTRSRKTARRRSSLSAIDLDDVTRKYTPRTNIAGFLEQAPEVTPAARKTSCASESHSTTQNVSALMVNEVRVSLLEIRSGDPALANVSASGGRFRGKKGNLNILLPHVSPACSSQVQQTSESTQSSRTSTPIKDVTTDADGNVDEAISEEDMPPVSPVYSVQSAGDTSTNAPIDIPAYDKSGRSEGEKSKGNDRNIFSDILGGINDDIHTSAGHEDAEAEVEADRETTPVQSSELETEDVQGGHKARTPTAVLISDRSMEDSARTPLEKSQLGSGRKGSTSRRSPYQPRRSSSRTASPAVRDQSESPQPESSSREKTPLASISISGDQLSQDTSSQRKISLNSSGQEVRLAVGSSSTGRTSEVKDGGLSDVSHTGKQSMGEGESATTRMASVSSAVSRLSKHFEDGDLAHSALRTSEEAVDAPSEEEDYGASAFAHTASVHDSTHRLSDNEKSSEGEEYSPLKTPRLSEKQRTPNTAFSRLNIRNRNTEETQRTSAADTRTGKASRPRKKPGQGLPTSVVKAAFTHFCQLRVSKEAIEEVEKMSEQYFKNMAEDLEAYALHAHRKTINESDVELLMNRQGFITDKCSLNTLIAKYLPLELRQEMIPIARSGNKLEPASK